MRKEEVIAVLEHRLEKAGRYYHALPGGDDGEVLHDYRVEMKKLRAFLHLLYTGRRHGKEVWTKEIRDIYHLSGEVRNLQLFVQWLEEKAVNSPLARPQSWLHVLGQRREEGIKRLRAMVQDLSFQTFAATILERAPVHLAGNTCSDYLFGMRHDFEDIVLQPFHSDESLHEARKIVKELGYNRGYLLLLLPSVLPQFSDRQGTEHFAGRLGAYQDLCVALGFLEPPGTVGAVCEERTSLEQIREMLISEKLLLKREVIQLLYQYR